MKKYLLIEVLVDESIEDCKECADDVISEAISHCYCNDGTVDIKIIEKYNIDK